MYADTITASMQQTIDETNRRREIQMRYNAEHGITPQPIQKALNMGDLVSLGQKSDQRAYVESEPTATLAIAESTEEQYSPDQLRKRIDQLRRMMQKAAKELNFVEAAQLRDEMLRLMALVEE